ncbi:unnamed protein product [Dicrocoelium dendriticum]|nr:unnamed protein product [Dicrocoelium dendriticum]
MLQSFHHGEFILLIEQDLDVGPAWREPPELEEAQKVNQKQDLDVAICHLSHSLCLYPTSVSNCQGNHVDVNTVAIDSLCI